MIKKNVLWNVFPKNKTQTKYFRFLKGPDSEIKTMFTKSIDDFNKSKKNINRDRLKTIYSKFLEE